MTEKQQADYAVMLGDFPDYHDNYQALIKNLYVPYFQPIVTLRTGQLAGFEVLARCQYPFQPVVTPANFIDEAESEGWMDELTRQILTKAFAAATAIPEHLTLSINISPTQLRHSGVVDQIRDLAESTGFALTRLIVEITESALIDNLERASAILSGLKSLGCKLALDDFGTGYSSLRHLQGLPLDELKVDQSFVSSMTARRESRKIVSAVVGLGQSLGLTTVAEGIESSEQAQMMLWLGCELGQGYFYGRPIPESKLKECILEIRTGIVGENATPWVKVSARKLEVSPTQRLAHLQAVYDGAPVGLAFIDQKLRYVNLNKRFADYNDKPLEDHLGSHVWEMIPELFPNVEGYLRRALSGEVIRDVEITLPHTGETRLVSYEPVLDEAGEVIGVSLALVDITARKQTEEALRQSEAHYRSMVELNPQRLWVMDPQGRNLEVRPRWDSVTGLKRPRQDEHNWLKSIHHDDIQSTVRSISESRRRREQINVQYRVADGAGWQWKQAIGSPRFDRRGKVVCWYGSVENIEAPASFVSRAKQPAKAESGIHLAASTAETHRLRQQALAELEILDTPAEDEFDDLVQLASELCAAPISFVSLLDTERQWFKASVGVEATETPLSWSFCKHVVEQEGVFVVENATEDPRFEHNPLVTGDPNIRFYAGTPLYSPDGIAIGALCVIDTVPRTFSPAQAKTLNILAQQVQARLELRAARKQLRETLPKTGANSRLFEGYPRPPVLA